MSESLMGGAAEPVQTPAQNTQQTTPPEGGQFTGPEWAKVFEV